MPDAVTLAVLRDLAVIGIFAILLAMAAYGLLRRAMPSSSWNFSGLVVSRPYDFQDVAVAVLLCWLLFFSLFSSPGSMGSEIKDGAEAVQSIEQVVGGMTAFLAICLCLLLYLAAGRGLNVAELFGVRLLSLPRALLIAFGFIVPVYIFVSMLGAAVQHYGLKDIWPNLGPQETVMTFQQSGSLAMKALLAIAAVVVAPLVEETIFRGFIYGVLKRFTDIPFAAMGSALLFAIVHLHVGSALPLFVLALSFCWAYERTGCLLVPVFMHAFFNGGSLVLLTIFEE